MQWPSPLCWERLRAAGQDIQSHGKMIAGSSLSFPIKDITSCRSRWVTKFCFPGVTAPSLWLLWLSCAWAHWCPEFLFFPSLAGYDRNESFLPGKSLMKASWLSQTLAVEMLILHTWKKGEWFVLWSENWVWCFSYVSLCFFPVCECEFPLPGLEEELQVSPGSLREGAGRENRLLGLSDSSCCCQ